MTPTLLRILSQRRTDIEADTSAHVNPRFITEARKEPSVFVELDTHQNDGYTVSLEWDRATGRTQIVAGDIRTTNQLVFAVPAANASDAFRHPFRYAHEHVHPL